MVTKGRDTLKPDQYRKISIFSAKSWKSFREIMDNNKNKGAER